MTDYRDFVASKVAPPLADGLIVPTSDLSPLLFDWQRDVVRWALRRGRAGHDHQLGGTRIIGIDVGRRFDIGDAAVGDFAACREWRQRGHGRRGSSGS